MVETRNKKAKVAKPSSSNATTSKGMDARGKGKAKAHTKPSRKNTLEKVIEPERQEQVQAQTAPLREPPVEWDEEEQAMYRAFQRIHVQPSRFLIPRFMTKLGLFEDMCDILSRMGMGFFANYRSHHFPDVTRQFFSTLEVRFDNQRKKDPRSCTLHFKVDNEAYTLSMAQVCEAYGFPNGSTLRFPKFREAERFWRVIGSGPYSSGTLKASLIRNPVLSFTHKLLANTVFARYDTSQIRSDELCLLFQGLKHIIRDENGEPFYDDIGDDVNLGYIFVKELPNFKKWVRTTPHPYLFYSTVLVPIFETAGVPLRMHYYDRIHDYINVPYLLKCRMLKPLRDEEDEQYVYIFRGSDNKKYTFPLPNKERTSLTSQGNIAFTHHEQIQEYRHQREAPSAPQEQRQPPHQPKALPSISSLTLPDIPFKPKTFREKWLHKAYKVQQNINKWMSFRLNKQEERMRRMPGFVPSPEEPFNEADFDDAEDDQQEEGDHVDDENEQEYEPPLSDPFFFPQQPRHSYAGASSSSAHTDYDTARHSLHMPPPPRY